MESLSFEMKTMVAMFPAEQRVSRVKHSDPEKGCEAWLADKKAANLLSLPVPSIDR
jgi:hypothetical protein